MELNWKNYSRAQSLCVYVHENVEGIKEERNFIDEFLMHLFCIVIVYICSIDTNTGVEMCDDSKI